MHREELGDANRYFLGSRLDSTGRVSRLGWNYPDIAASCPQARFYTSLAVCNRTLRRTRVAILSSRTIRSFSHTLESRSIIAENAETIHQSTTASKSHIDGDMGVEARDDTKDHEAQMCSLSNDEIKLFKYLWHRRIIRVSRDFKVSSHGSESKFSMSFRMQNKTGDGKDIRLRVRGELDSSSLVCAYSSSNT